MMRLELESERNTEDVIKEHLKCYPATLGYIQREVIPRVGDLRAKQCAVKGLEQLQLEAGSRS